MKEQTIYLLVGAKGSGKTFIGSLMEKEFNVRFLRVEDWAKHIKKGRSIHDESYLKEVFATIENGVRVQLQEHQSIVFESTGLTHYFDQMLNSLKKDFKMIVIGVLADLKLCTARVRTRDRQIHIDVSEEQLMEINKQVVSNMMATDHIVSNDNKPVHSLIRELGIIVNQEAT